MSDYQVRSARTQFSARSEETGRVIAGYFAVFGDVYEIWPGMSETIAPTAFDGMEGRDIRALCNHDETMVLGRTTAGTLTLRVDEHGLYCEIKINENDSDAMNLYARVQRGDVSQCSFGFCIDSETYDQHPDGTELVTLNAVTLHEVSVVTFPAYEATHVEARSSAYKDERRLKHWREKMKGRIHK